MATRASGMVKAGCMLWTQPFKRVRKNEAGYGWVSTAAPNGAFAPHSPRIHHALPTPSPAPTDRTMGPSWRQV